METEIKLLVSPGQLARLARTRAVRDAARGPSRSSLMHAVYYDTPHFALRKRHMALRIRREGRTWKQTAKAAGNSLGGLEERRELEWSVPGPRMDLSLLQHSELAEVFSKPRLARELGPIFCTRFTRRSLPIALARGSSAVLALDRGSIIAGRKSEPICEAEVELLGGDAAALLDFVEALLEEVPCRIGHASKAERAHMLISGKRPRKWEPVDIDPAASASYACRQLLDACAAQLNANEQGFLSTRDPEYLHQMRAGMRRLRVALALPREEPSRQAIGALKGELKWASGLLGAARNWDVFDGELLPALAHACGEESLAALRSRVARHRREARAAAREAVLSTRYQLLGIALARLGLQSADAGSLDARAFAQRALARRYRKLMASHDPAALDPSELHRLRIAAKKMRYVAEFFESLHPAKKVKRFTARLQRLQDVLGAINDTQVSARMVQVSSRGRRSMLDREVVGLARGWIAAREAAAREHLGKAWQAFRSLRPYWS